MKSFTEIAVFYEKRFAFYKEPVLNKQVSQDLSTIIVIPSFNEELEETLSSLEKCVLKDESRVELVIVLNHGENAPDSIKQLHKEQYDGYTGLVLKNGLAVNPIKAFDLPKKHAGVGLARKIGMDEALQRFKTINKDGLIVCLDADCTVSENYLESIVKAEEKGVGGLSLYYEHPFETLSSGFERKSIVQYEIFLRYYSLGLKYAGYPFPFQTVGSSMGSRASNYAKIGGMNRKKAGEDFYFLHKLFPQGNFHEHIESTVYPSARKSDRVPFGTGKAMLAMEKGEKDYGLLYNPKVLECIRISLSNLNSIFNHNFLNLNEFESFIESESLTTELKDLSQRSKNFKQFEKNFFHWFDGFKMLRFIHFLQSIYPDIQNLEACRKLLQIDVEKEEDLLLILRDMEKSNPHMYI